MKKQSATRPCRAHARARDTQAEATGTKNRLFQIHSNSFSPRNLLRFHLKLKRGAALAVRSPVPGPGPILHPSGKTKPNRLNYLAGSGRDKQSRYRINGRLQRPQGYNSTVPNAGRREPRVGPTWKMAVPAEKKEEGPRRAPYKGLWAARGTAFRERQPKAAFQGKGVVSENQKTL